MSDDKRTMTAVLNAITEKYLPDVVDVMFRSYHCNNGHHSRCGILLLGVSVPGEREYCQCECHHEDH